MTRFKNADKGEERRREIAYQDGAEDRKQSEKSALFRKYLAEEDYTDYHGS